MACLGATEEDKRSWTIQPATRPRFEHGTIGIHKRTANLPEVPCAVTFSDILALWRLKEDEFTSSRGQPPAISCVCH
jgi:hypothetical protein